MTTETMVPPACPKCLKADRVEDADAEARQCWDRTMEQTGEPPYRFLPPATPGGKPVRDFQPRPDEPAWFCARCASFIEYLIERLAWEAAHPQPDLPATPPQKASGTRKKVEAALIRPPTLDDALWRSLSDEDLRAVIDRVTAEQARRHQEKEGPRPEPKKKRKKGGVQAGPVEAVLPAPSTDEAAIAGAVNAMRGAPDDDPPGPLEAELAAPSNGPARQARAGRTT